MKRKIQQGMNYNSEGFSLRKIVREKNLNKFEICAGFTLIELLVVISIISVLISLSFVGFSQARKSARDSKRKADLEQIRAALELYRNDCKTYPNTLTFGGSLIGEEESCKNNIYMQAVPSDPLTGYNYWYAKTGPNSYVLCSYMETETASVSSYCSDNKCGGTGDSCKYQVFNP